MVSTGSAGTAAVGAAHAVSCAAASASTTGITKAGSLICGNHGRNAGRNRVRWQNCVIERGCYHPAMPELPEVETTRRGIATIMPGRILRQLVVHEPRLRWPVPAGLPDLVRDQPVLACERRGKYLLIRFGHGTQIVHLGMSGSLRRVPMDETLRKHDHVEWCFDDARFLLHDPRRFGAVLWHPADAGPIGAHPLLAGLGIEPFDPGFTPEVLHAG